MKKIQTPVNFSTKNAIVDVEIRNDIKKFGWDYSRGEITVAGFFIDNKIVQLMIMNLSKLEEFKKLVTDHLSTIENSKLYALNTNMETGAFHNLLGRSPKFHEISPFAGRGASKEYFFGFLVKNKIIEPQAIGFTDPLNGNSFLTLEKWKIGKYEDVRQHNLCCLTKEAKILEYKNLIIKKHSHLLENGWVKRGETLPSL